MNEQQFSITGTTCQSCEVVIEREVKKLPSIQSVSVSHAAKRITITTDGTTITHTELTAHLNPMNYQVSPLTSETRQTQPNHIDWKRIAKIAALLLIGYYLLDRLGILRYSPSTTNPSGYIGIIGVGILASLSSCTAVVGGLVAAVGSQLSSTLPNTSAKERFTPHLLFNLGRILGFFILGAVIGFAGSAIQLSPTLNGLFVVIVALLMILIGINLLELFPHNLVRMPKWLAHKVHELSESKDPFAPIFLGAMTFFLPCGFTQSMQLYALTLGSPVQAGLVMAAFALGTTPVLLGIGKLTTQSSGETLKRVTHIAGAIVLILGLSQVLNGLALLGVTKETLFGAQSLEGPMSTEIVQGRQQITMRMTSAGLYQPDVLTVQEGIPVDWTIIGDKFLGCGDTLIMPAFGINTTLKTGTNLVQFTPTKSGRFSFSCSMGMIRGTMIVTAK